MSDKNKNNQVTNEPACIELKMTPDGDASITSHGDVTEQLELVAGYLAFIIAKTEIPPCVLFDFLGSRTKELFDLINKKLAFEPDEANATETTEE